MNLDEQNQQKEDSKENRPNQLHKSNVLVRAILGYTFNEETKQWEKQCNVVNAGNYCVRCAENLPDILRGNVDIIKYVNGKPYSRKSYFKHDKVRAEEEYNNLVTSSDSQPVPVWRTTYHENGKIMKNESYDESGNLISCYCYDEKGGRTFSQIVSIISANQLSKRNADNISIMYPNFKAIKSINENYTKSGVFQKKRVVIDKNGQEHLIWRNESVPEIVQLPNEYKNGVLTFREFKIDENGQETLVKRTEIKYNGSKFACCNVDYHYVYDGNGNLLEKTDYRYNYYANGNIKMSCKYKSDKLVEQSIWDDFGERIIEHKKLDANDCILSK